MQKPKGVDWSDAQRLEEATWRDQIAGSPASLLEELVDALALQRFIERSGVRYSSAIDVGVGPLEVDDSTQVTAAVEGRRLVLEARVRPIGRARVAFSLADAGAGRTRVTMDEEVLEPAIARHLRVLTDPLIHGRNAAFGRPGIVGDGAMGQAEH